MFYFFFICYGSHLDLHGLTHSFPTRRSSDLRRPRLHRIARRKPGISCLPPQVGRAGVLRRFRRPRGLFEGERCRRGAVERHKGQPQALPRGNVAAFRSEEHTSELQSLMRISYAVFCLKKKTINTHKKVITYITTSDYRIQQRDCKM